MFYPIFFALELLIYINNTYTKYCYNIELKMDPLFFLCIIFSCNVHFEAFYATEARMVLRYYYILEPTTIFADDIHIQEGDSLP